MGCEDKPILIGIAGPSGSGKTELARRSRYAWSAAFAAGRPNRPGDPCTPRGVAGRNPMSEDSRARASSLFPLRGQRPTPAANVCHGTSRAPIDAWAPAENVRGPTANVCHSSSRAPIDAWASAENVRGPAPPPTRSARWQAWPGCRLRNIRPACNRCRSASRHGTGPEVERKTSGPFRAAVTATQQVVKEQAPTHRWASRTRTKPRGATTDAERSIADLAGNIANTERRCCRFRTQRGFGSTTLHGPTR
jgi:hypothetical protein